MSRRAVFTADDYARAIKGALKGGLPVGTFKVAVENGALAILPVPAGEALPSPDSGEAEWDRALGLQ